MALTLAQARRDTRLLLGEPTAVRWSDTVLTLLLSLLQQHVSASTFAYQRTVHLTEADGVLVPGVRQYLVEGTQGPGVLGIDDDLSLLQVFVDGVELPQINPTMPSSFNERTRSPGALQGWFHYADWCFVVPVPTTAALTSYQLDIVYAAMPEEWTEDDDVSVLPDGLSDVIVYGTAALAWQMRRFYGEAAQALSLYDTLLSSYLGTTTFRRVTTRPALKLPASTLRPVPRQQARA